MKNKKLIFLLCISVILLLPFISFAQTDNRTPEYRFWGVVGINTQGYLTLKDTANYAMQIGDSTLGKGMILPIGNSLTLPPVKGGFVYNLSDSSLYYSDGNKWNDINNKLFINVKDYGAKGDSTTDDTHTIQNAFNAVPASGAIVFFPSGKYIISSPIHVKNSCTVLGTGGFNTYGDITRPFTHLLYANSQIIDNSDSSAFIVNVDKTQWKDIGIANSDTSNFGIGIKFNNGYGVIMDGINVMGFDTCIYMMNGNHYVLTNSQIYYWKNYGFIHSDNNNKDEGSVKISNTEFYSGTVLSTAYLKIISGGGITITNCEFEIGSYSAIPPYGILVDSGFRSSIIELSNSYIEGFTNSAFAFIGGVTGQLSGVSINGNYFNSATNNINTKIIDFENNSSSFTNDGDINIVGNTMNQDYSSAYNLKYVYLKNLINATITSNVFKSNNTFNQDSMIVVINTPNTLILQDSISAKSLTLNGTIIDSFYKAPASDTLAAGFDQNGNMVTFPKSSGSVTPTLQQVTTAGNSTNTGLIVNSPGSNGGILINTYMPMGFSNNSGVSFLGYNFTLSSSNVVHQLISGQYSNAIGLNSSNTPIFYSANPGTADAIWPSFFVSYPLATESWVNSLGYITNNLASSNLKQTSSVLRTYNLNSGTLTFVDSTLFPVIPPFGNAHFSNDLDVLGGYSPYNTHYGSILMGSNGLTDTLNSRLVLTAANLGTLTGAFMSQLTLDTLGMSFAASSPVTTVFNVDKRGDGRFYGNLGIVGDSLTMWPKTYTMTSPTIQSFQTRLNSSMNLTALDSVTAPVSGLDMYTNSLSLELDNTASIQASGVVNMITGVRGALGLNMSGTTTKLWSANANIAGIVGTVSIFNNANYENISAIAAASPFSYTQGTYTKFTGTIDTSSQLYLQSNPGSTYNIDGTISNPYGIYQASNYPNRFSGGIQMPILVVTTSTTVTKSNYSVINASGTNTFTIPAASSCSGQVFHFVCNTGTITLSIGYLNYSGTSTTTIAAGSGVTIQSNGTSYYQIGQ